jgi:transcriptional regulator with XRE-family HTH domain
LAPTQPPEERSFGYLLRRYRLASLLTQEQLAERAHLSYRAISDLERGAKHTPRRDTVLLLADALQLSPQERAALIAAIQPRDQSEAGVLPDDQPSSQASVRAFLIADVRGSTQVPSACTMTLLSSRTIPI